MGESSEGGSGFGLSRTREGESRSIRGRGTSDRSLFTVGVACGAGMTTTLTPKAPESIAGQLPDCPSTKWSTDMDVVAEQVR